MSRPRRGSAPIRPRSPLREPPATKFASSGPSRLNCPSRSLQTVHLVEMPISGNENHPMMLRRGSDPDVVLRQGPPFFLQTLFQTPILSGNLEIARNHCPAGRKSVYLGRVLGGAADFAAPKNSSPSTIDGMKTSNARPRLDTTVSSPSSQGNDDIGVQLESTSQWRQLVRTPHRSLASSAERKGSRVTSRTGVTLCRSLPSGRRGKRSHEPEHPFLHVGREFLNFLCDLLSEIHLRLPLPPRIHRRNRTQPIRRPRSPKPRA